jgi:hypothetical protein
MNENENPNQNPDCYGWRCTSSTGAVRPYAGGYPLVVNLCTDRLAFAQRCTVPYFPAGASA